MPEKSPRNIIAQGFLFVVQRDDWSQQRLEDRRSLELQMGNSESGSDSGHVHEDMGVFPREELDDNRNKPAFLQRSLQMVADTNGCIVRISKNNKLRSLFDKV